MTGTVHATTVDTVYHYAIAVLIVHVAKNVSMVDVDLCVLLETNVQKDKYAFKVFAFLDAIVIETVEMTCYVPLNYVN